MKRIQGMSLALIFLTTIYLSPAFADVMGPKAEFSEFMSPAKVEFNASIHAMLSQLLKNHREIQTYQNRVETAQNTYRQSVGLYLPSVDIIGDAGLEKIEKEYDPDTDEWRHEVRARATQLITDFGRTTNTIQRDRIALEQARASLQAITQQMLREGISAYINIVRARERLASAKLSESRIKELTGIEKALVEKGAGLTSDVLQAKSQLAGAMALKVEAQGELNIARNHFQALFYHYPTQEEISRFDEISLPSTLPQDLEAAVATALNNHPEILITQYDLDLSRKEVSISKSAYFPSFRLFAEAIHADDDNGARGYRRDYSAGMEFNYNIFRGGSDQAAVSRAMATRTAAATHLAHARHLIQEQVKNSWEQFQTLTQRKALLDQQTDILKNFLDLAKKERTMGTRSLLDVLNGEVNYINAQGTAIAAREDMKIAAYTLLFAMGEINLELFTP